MTPSTPPDPIPTIPVAKIAPPLPPSKPSKTKLVLSLTVAGIGATVCVVCLVGSLVYYFKVAAPSGESAIVGQWAMASEPKKFWIEFSDGGRGKNMYNGTMLWKIETGKISGKPMLIWQYDTRENDISRYYFKREGDTLLLFDADHGTDPSPKLTNPSFKLVAWKQWKD
jgi:hypothetical protein